MSDPEQKVDHFKFWSFGQLPFDRWITTQGPFDAGRRERHIIAFDSIGNPVSKNDSEIRRPELHLTGYTVEINPGVAEPIRRVTFSNQFTDNAAGVDQWDISDPALLLVPAGQSFLDGPPPEIPPPPVTHYLCYSVVRGDVVDRTVTLLDQFDLFLRREEMVGPLLPAYFGVPVEKNGEPIGDPEVHLCIYRFQSRGHVPPVFIHTADQFIPPMSAFLSAQMPSMLAVPSIKRGVVVV